MMETMYPDDGWLSKWMGNQTWKSTENGRVLGCKKLDLPESGRIGPLGVSEDFFPYHWASYFQPKKRELDCPTCNPITLEGARTLGDRHIITVSRGERFPN